MEPTANRADPATPPTSSSEMKRPGAIRAKAGFTLLEMLLVLALLGLMAALVLPRVGQTLDQTVAQSEAFKFEQQVLDLRRQAFHQEVPIQVVASGNLTDEAEPRQAEVSLGQDWSYSLEAPLLIDAGGLCSTTTAELTYRGRVAMRLQGTGPACRFQRVVG